MRFTRALFVRLIAGIFLVAFLSAAAQMRGLYGENGISPVSRLLSQAQGHPTLEFFLNFPSIFWFDSSDTALVSVPLVGAFVSCLALLGVLTGPCMLVSWFLYLSIVTVGQEFMSFQWDILLLETGFLCIFLGSWRPLDFFYSLIGEQTASLEGRVDPSPSPGAVSAEAYEQPIVNSEVAAPDPSEWKTNSKLPKWKIDLVEPSVALIWLCRLLLFRLMFQSGLCKLESGDETWRNLTAMNYHYETQPLPTPLGWFAHQMPDPVLMLSTASVFVLELLLPLLIFAGRRARLVVAIGTVFLQVLILLTGNYCFFNLLTIALCVVLLDDARLMQCLSFKKWRRVKRDMDVPNSKKLNDHESVPVSEPDVDVPNSEKVNDLANKTESVPISKLNIDVPNSGKLDELAAKIKSVPVSTPGLLRNVVIVPLTILIVFLSVSRTMFTIGGVPSLLYAVAEICQPWHLVSSYGLFAVMTTSRPEISIEGSMDGKNWKEYTFKYKPGPLDRAPPIVAPHQPRLDWQMWFAALGTVLENQWLVSFAEKLLEGSPDVLALLETDPYHGEKPKYIRASVYDYHMENLPTLLSTGRWWKRTYTGVYLPAITKTAEL